MYCVTKWCASITDNGRPIYTGNKKRLVEKEVLKHGKCPQLYRFRLLDDDGVVYAYGLSDDCDSERAFAPLDMYGPQYGCTQIQYINAQTKRYETL